MNYEYYHLMAKPSFIEGMARVLDINCNLDSYNQSITPEEADMVAIYSDWLAIGGDMQGVMGNEQTQEEQE